MIALMMAGLGFGLGHHFYYRSLDGLEAVTSSNHSVLGTDSEEWKIRFGTAFAVLTNAYLCTAVAVAYKEHIWTTMKKKVITVSGHDATFTALNDFFSFLNHDYLSKVKVGIALALITW
jgi:hypothetical protein